MNPLRAPRRLLGTGLAGVLLLSACAGQAGPASNGNEPDEAPAASAPPTPSASGPVPTPSASGPVSAVATVLQKGDGQPELCLGGVAESLPPQCGGPEIVGWDWDAVESDSASGTTWGAYAVEGTWDGETFHLTEAPAAPDEWPARPIPYDSRLDPDNAGTIGPDTPQSETDELQNEVFDDLDGLSGWVENGYVWVTVVYDDGSLQRYADDKYGADTVAVLSALRDVG